MRRCGRVVPLVLLAGCAGLGSFPALAEQDDPRARAELVDRLPAAAAGTRTFRLTLERGGVEWDLTLLVRRIPPDGLLLAGVSDFGGTDFQVRRDAGGLEVLRDSRVADAGFLAEHLVPDLTAALLPPSAEHVSLVRDAAGGAGLHVRQDGGEVLWRPQPHGGWQVVRGERGRTRSVIDVDEGAVRVAGDGYRAELRPVPTERAR